MLISLAGGASKGARSLDSANERTFEAFYKFVPISLPPQWYGMGWDGMDSDRDASASDSRCICVCVWAFVKYYIDILDFACTNIYVHIFPKHIAPRMKSQLVCKFVALPLYYYPISR